MTVGEPKLFSMTTTRPLGPRVVLTGAGELGDAAEDGLAGVVVELNAFGWHLCFFRFGLVLEVELADARWGSSEARG